jgi:signal transduction histidine kinase/DNA-binding response OmpR family regulator
MAEVMTEAERGAAHSYEEDINWLRSQMLQRLVWASIIGSIAWFLVVSAYYQSFNLREWLGPLSLILFAGVVYYVARYSSIAGACVLVAGMAASFGTTAWAYRDPHYLILLALPVGVAGLIIGPSISFALAAAFGAGAYLAIYNLSSMRFMATMVTRLTLVVGGAIALLLWVAMYPLRTTVHWAWASYERARQQTDTLRDHKARLSRTLKDLDAAYNHLETMANDLERARKASEEARRLKSEFAANISHELRTPLNLIIGFSEMMAMAPHTYDGEPLPAAYRGDVQAIYRNAQHLSNLIDDVLDLSQIEAGRMGLIKEPASPSEVVAEAVNAVGHLFESKGLTLTTSVPAQLPILEMDRTRVRQVLINLLNNAARFTDQGGVTVTATVDEREVTVAVADTGVGIAEADMPKVFEQFRQIDGSTRRRYGGSGLGLAISKKFVELHGGRMWVISHVNAGTTFYFSLPLRSDLGIGHLPPEWETWARLAPAKPGQRTIALLDTDPSRARVIERYLDGYHVTPVAGPDELRHLAAREPLHALVLTAPSGEEGWQRLRQAREGLTDLPVIVCTMSNTEEVRRPAGATTCLVKPVSRERFLAALSSLGSQVRSLLIVDDDPEVVRLLSRMVRLAPQQYTVMKAYGGAEAMALLRKRRPGAVILDLLAPEVDGYTMLEQMQADERLCHIPVVAVVTKGQEEGGITAGMVGVTRRDGFSVGELIRCLKASLDSLTPPAPTYSAPKSPAVSPASRA